MTIKSPLSTGKGMYATFGNINTPGMSTFQSYIDGGLARMSVFTFVPSATSLPVTADWYTSSAGQPQGLSTSGNSTVETWQGLFQALHQAGVAIGFVFGGQGATVNIGPMMEGLNANPTDFAAFVETLQSYHVSYIEFDIETTWDTPPGFSEQFATFAENLTSHSNGSIAIFVGASAPVGTVNGAGSNIPSSINPAFVAANNIYFIVYTYYQLEVANVLDDPTPWIPSETAIDPIRIGFSVTCNASTDVPSGQIGFSTFMEGFPNSYFRTTVEEKGYMGMFCWVWWCNNSLYPEANLQDLSDATP